MATAVLQTAKPTNTSRFSAMSNARRHNDSPEASTSRYPKPAAAADVFGSSSTPEPASRSFHKLRSSLEQSLRTATRSKKPPAPPVEDFATITGKTKKGKEKETQPLDDATARENRSRLFRRVTFRKGDRDSPTPAPVHDETRRSKDRVAGHTSFITPSMRLASMSSPALHLSSQALPSPTSQPTVNVSSSSNVDSLVSPTRSRTRRISLQPTAREAYNPTFSAKLDPNQKPNPGTRHKSSKSVPVPVPTASSSTSLVSPSTTSSTHARVRIAPSNPHDTIGAPRPLSPRAHSSSIAPRASSPSTPTRARSPNVNRVRVASPSRGIGSSSTSHLPLSSSPSPPPRRPSIDSRRPSVDTSRRPSGEVPRRVSLDAGNRQRGDSPTPFRADSPLASPVSPRSRTPSQRTYSQNRHYNISSGSLLLPPSNPEHRDLIRNATSMLCKEVIKAPPHMLKSEQGVRDWDEVEYRTRALARLERIWGRSGFVNGSTVGSPQAVSATGEERERRVFCEALRDGFVLCQLLNKLRGSNVVRPDPKEDGLTKTSNISKFLAACASYGLPQEDLFQREDLIEPTSESLARVASTIIALVKFVESPAPSRSKYMSGQTRSVNPATRSPYGTLTGVSASTPNLHASSTSPVSPNRRRWSPPDDLPPVRSYSPDQPSSGSAKTIRRSIDSNLEAMGDGGHELEVKPMNVPIIGKPPPPPKSPLRKQSSRTQDPGGLATWAKQAASPPSSPPRDVPLSQDPSRMHSRQSMAASVITTTTILSTAPSSTFDSPHRHSSNHYGTIRSVTTDMTSEAPSVRFESSPFEEDTVRKASNELPPALPPKFRDRRSGEVRNVDLSRVAEETDDSGSRGSSSRDGKESSNRTNQPASPIEKPAINLRKGKWPDDFLDAFDKRQKPQLSISPSSSTPEIDGGLSRGASPVSISSPRKLAVVSRATPTEDGGLSQFPRRPSHRPRHSVDGTPGLLPREVALRRDASPDSLSTAASASSRGVLMRRHSTKPAIRRAGSRGPRTEDDALGSDDSLVPFPRAVSGDTQASGSPSPVSSSSGGGTSVAERPRLRGRFQSDIGSSSARSRAGSRDDAQGKVVRRRLESMVNLGGSSNAASASDLRLSRNSLEGAPSARSLVVKEDGKAPVHFQLGNCIGRGQFGSVYRALNLNTGQMVAVKRIRLDGLKEEEVTQLMREVDLVKNLSHPSIVKYEGMSRDEDHLSIILEYAENGSLSQTLKAFGKFNERLVASYVVKILEGLHYLHTSDVVHCDLKAANILTTKNGNVKLSDFGVSLNLRAMEREIKDVAGTPNWMAPEVIELKGASTKSDIWSLGCTVIELLTGRPPYSEIANSMSVMFRIVEDEMPPLPDSCSELLQDFLQQCFQKDASARPSAEMLCEHAWLKTSWQELKDLRPQDSIPFLRRVSTDLQQKPDVVRYLSQMDTSDSPVSETFVRGDAGKITPMGRRTSTSSVRPIPENDIGPREHSFVKTTFSKPMMCRVCLLHVKKSAVLCAQCSLISHAKCAVNAPPTCDLRAQLLLYAQYAEKGNPSSAYSNPVDVSGEPKRPGAMSDVSYVAHSSAHGRASVETPPPASPPAAVVSESPPSAYRFMAAFKRSRSNLSPEPQSKSPASTPRLHDAEERPRQRKTTLLQKRPPERPKSVMSDSTGVSSLRSVATAAESMSSRHRSQQSSGGRASKPPRISSNATISVTESGVNRSPSQLPSELSTSSSYFTHSTGSQDTRGLRGLYPRHKRNTKSTESGNCIIQ